MPQNSSELNLFDAPLNSYRIPLQLFFSSLTAFIVNIVDSDLSLNLRGPSGIADSLTIIVITNDHHSNSVGLSRC